MSQKTIEQRFQKLDDITHTILRPGMYLGSTKTAPDEIYFLQDDGKFVTKIVQINPGFLKIFDEIVSNAADEHRRGSKLDRIDVVVNQETGFVCVKDNGGIPVVKHTVHDQYVPELIFSNLKAGSNFDDTESRLVAGTNGVGSTLTNIFSLKFRVHTSDGKNIFDQTFSSNMRERTEPIVKKSVDKNGFTEITYQPDFKQFGLSGIDDAHLAAMKKRCADLAACNPKLFVSFNGQSFSYPQFAAYCKLYVNDICYEESERWKIAVGPSNGSMQHVSFVNGVTTKDGGTHVDFVSNQIIEAVRERLKKKHKVELKPSEIKNHMFVFVSADIVNSSFSSQTKEKLITDPRDFGSKHELSDKFLKLVCASEMIQRILDWAQQKQLAEEKKALRELNKKLDREKVLKLIDAKSNKRSECSLSLFEGDCISENEEIVVFRTGEGKNSVKAKDVIIGDFVITHNNNLKEVVAISKKISKLLTIKTHLGHIKCSAAHRLWTYNTQIDKFDFVRVDCLDTKIHKLVKNKLNTAQLFLKIECIQEKTNSFVIECDDEKIVSSKEHKFAIFDLNLRQFLLVCAKDLDADNHMIVLNEIVPQK